MSKKTAGERSTSQKRSSSDHENPAYTANPPSDYEEIHQQLKVSNKDESDYETMRGAECTVYSNSNVKVLKSGVSEFVLIYSVS